MKLWVAESDIIITTALMPGKDTPKLITQDMILAMNPGSVIVDMAASSQGGNCDLSQPNKVITTKNGVKIIGYTDLPSRAANTASALYAQNIAKFILSCGPATNATLGQMFYPDYADPAVRAMLIVDKGDLRWPDLNPFPSDAPSSVTSAASS